ncbi:hypothetical protein BK809_0003948 [Diplodia seriata]|uniref:RING-type domain-containing protein n=1 Tax=Diplodia seriata TaxID=420778 RepID=A0A1S8BD69_9PEZI|nr:hypothetical protein BK809_0003948 [Diplodia seriata]
MPRSSNPNIWTATTKNDYNYYDVLDTEPCLPEHQTHLGRVAALCTAPPKPPCRGVPCLRKPARLTYESYTTVLHTPKTFSLKGVNRWARQPLHWDLGRLRQLGEQELLDAESARCDICCQPWGCMAREDLERIAPEMVEEEKEEEEETEDKKTERSGGCRDPVALKCGHFFGRACLAAWLRESNSCPMCRDVVRLPITTTSTAVRW